MRDDPLVRVLIASDERGNLGRSMKGERFYGIVGTTIMRQSEFEVASRPYFEILGREVKYHDDPLLRKPIMKRAAPYVIQTYIVKYRKDPRIHNFDGGLDADEHESIHLAMVQGLADRIMKDVDSEYVDAVVDHSDLVKDYKIRRIFEDNPYADGSVIRCNVADSASNFTLMTNDFIVGAVGANATDATDADAREMVGMLTRKPKIVHIRNKKPWRLRRWR